MLACIAPNIVQDLSASISSCSSSWVRAYPHIECFTAGKFDRQPEPIAAITGGAHQTDFHLAHNRGGLAEVIERNARLS